jgi:hypothetical protein
MQRNLLPLGLFFIASSIHAQTLNDPENVPVIGSVYNVHAAPFVDPGAGGSGTTWDFSSLGSDSMVTYQIVDPASSQWATMFPDAQEAITNGVDTIFYNVTSSGMERVGEDVMFVTFDVQVPFTNSQLDLQLPCSMGTNWTDLIGATYDIPGLGTATRTGSITGDADGTGTLMIPSGTVYGCVRVYTHLSETDNVGFTSATRKRHEWVWYTNYQKFPLLRITADTISITIPSVTQVTRRVEWLDTASVGMEEYKAEAGFVIWPNPASGEVAIELAPSRFDRTVRFTDATGRVALEQKIGAGTMTRNIDISSLNPGPYAVTLLAADGSKKSARLMVAR